jgi:hypothetical protein
MGFHNSSEPSDSLRFVAIERRHMPDRRDYWRGGRRETDWFNRPIAAWRELAQRPSPLRPWIATLPLHHMAPDRPQGR